MDMDRTTVQQAPQTNANVMNDAVLDENNLIALKNHVPPKTLELVTSDIGIVCIKRMAKKRWRMCSSTW